jgi:hypothetical protein
MVAEGLTPRIVAAVEFVRFELINSGVGHAFPTYTVPTVMMNAVALKADGAPEPETLRSHLIARRVRYGDGTHRWIELSDTFHGTDETASASGSMSCLMISMLRTFFPT